MVIQGSKSNLAQNELENSDRDPIQSQVERFFVRHRKELEKYCKNKLHTYASYTHDYSIDHRDVLQEAFFRLNKYCEGKELPDYALPLLKRMITYMLIDYSRKERPKSFVDLDDNLNNIHIIDSVDLQKSLEHGEALSFLKKEIANTLPKEQELLTLYLEGYTPKEIAKMLEKNAEEISREMNRVMAKFRARLKKITLFR